MSYRNYTPVFEYHIYVNGTHIKSSYSLKKAIDIAQQRSGQLFEQRKVEVINSLTGEVIYQIN